MIRILAALLSIGVLAYLGWLGVTGWVILGVLLSYALWAIAVFLPDFRDNSEPQMSTDSMGYDPANAISTIDKYYVRLLLNARHSVTSLHYRLSNSAEVATNIAQGLHHARGLANETGLLAENSVSIAADTGEVGRGFVSVSTEVASISRQINGDLRTLAEMLGCFQQTLASLHSLFQGAPSVWMELERIHFAEQLKLVEQDLVSLERYKERLLALYQRYEDNPHREVRWLQLCDSLTRVISELILTAESVSGAVNEVASDMRIFNIREGLSSEQKADISAALASVDALDAKIVENLQ